MIELTDATITAGACIVMPIVITVAAVIGSHLAPKDH